MRRRYFVFATLATAIVVGCTFGDLADYPIAGDVAADASPEASGPINVETGGDGGGAGPIDAATSDAGSEPSEGGAQYCAEDGGILVPSGTALPCSELENGTAVTFPLPNNPVGICHIGTRKCLPSGQFDVCRDAIGAKTVDCTSPQDNDCDGTIDNVQCTGCVKVDSTQAKLGDQAPCFDFAAPAKPDTGVCKSGQKTCGVDPANAAKLAWGPCANEAGPSAGTTATKDLTCTATSDENCDGTPKEGCNCTANVDHRTCGDCKHTQQTCGADGNFPACPASSQDTWNGIVIGGACSVGTGACKGNGTVQCPSNGGNATCSGVASPAGPKNCAFSTDSDCNGIGDQDEAACKCGGSGVGQTTGCDVCGGTQTCQAQGSSAVWSGCSKNSSTSSKPAGAAKSFTDGTTENTVFDTWSPGTTAPGHAYLLNFSIKQSGNVDTTSSTVAFEIGCSDGSGVETFSSANFGPNNGTGASGTVVCQQGTYVYFKKRTNLGGGCCGGYVRTITLGTYTATTCP